MAKKIENHKAEKLTIRPKMTIRPKLQNIWAKIGLPDICNGWVEQTGPLVCLSLFSIICWIMEKLVTYIAPKIVLSYNVLIHGGC